MDMTKMLVLQTLELSRMLKRYYDCFVSEGFTADQALSLTKEVLKIAISPREEQNDSKENVK